MSNTHFIPSQGVLGSAGESEPNFLDLALEESDEGSDDEWEEVMCAANDTPVDRPLIAAPSGFTLPTYGKRSEFLTLEVVEDWQAVQELEADLQLEAELAEGLADLNPPALGPSCAPGTENSSMNTSPSPRPSAHLKLEVVEQPSAEVGCKPVEPPHKSGKHATPPQVPSTCKPTVSFKEKVAELARSTGRLPPPSKPSPSHNPSAIPPFSATKGPPSTLNDSPDPLTQVTSTSDLSRPTPRLFTPKGFSGRVQNLRERQTKDNLRRFHERYEGVIVEHPRRDLVGLMSAYTSMGSSDASKSTQPTQRRRVQKPADGKKRMSKAQAQAEEVMKICRSAKSYIVDMAAIKRRGVPTPPEPQHPTLAITSSSGRPASIRSGKTAPAIVGQQVAPLPIPQLPSTSLGGVPRGLKFTRKRKPAEEPGEVTTEAVGRVASSERDFRGPKLASVTRNDGPLAADAPKRRREDLGRDPEVPSPRKKPRFGRS